MKKKSEQNKDDHLGIPFGTASARLKKLIMFDLVRRLNENICFKCSLEIETSEELTVEHKIPWLRGDVGLFWDISNIAFSHRKCNKPDRPSPGKTRKIPPSDNLSWCSEHKEFLDKDKFTKNKHSWDGLEQTCRECKAKRQKKYRDSL